MLAKDFIRRLLKEGWEIDRIEGSHHILKKGNETVSIPVHNKDMGKGLLHNLLKKPALINRR